jgi:23S rRNA (uracil1939-C5)-methyltransferase
MDRDAFFTAPVEHIAAGGDGVLRYRGEAYFMSLTAPGDRVVGRITGKNRAELVELAEASPLRVRPVCPLYGGCGGCSLQHLSYEAQLAEKKLILEDSLRRIGGLSVPPAVKVLPSPPWEYRNRFEFHRVPVNGRAPAAGFKGRKSGTVVPAPDCPVADPVIRRALREGRVRPPPEKDRFTVYGRGGLLLCEGGNQAGEVSFLGRTLVMDGGLFFQSNGTMLEALLRDLRILAEGTDPALPMADLYAGVGTFAACLGDRFSRIDLLEENKPALGLARKNLAGGNQEVRFFAMTDNQWVKNMTSARGKKTASGPAGAYGFALADPPRQGLSPAMAQWLARRGPPALAYVSCSAAALARDSRILLAGGYRLDSLTLYDFYPQTAHIESLGVFRRDSR